MARTESGVKAPREQARTRAARRAVGTAAAELFTAHGYVATTIEAISACAQVPAPTVYRLFDGKIGILRAVLDVAIAGDDEPVEVAARPDVAAVFAGGDAAAMIDGVVAITTDINRRSNAIHHVLVAAAAADAAARSLVDDLATQRGMGQRRLTQALDRLGALRPDVTEQQAADIVHALMAPELYRSLVVERGWTPEQYREWLAGTLREQLLVRRRRIEA